MITEDQLRTAAGTINDMSEAELRHKFRQMRARLGGRTPHEALRQQSELDSLELDEAAYRLAARAEEAGDLATAARWYRAAALNDFADAALRLAAVLHAQAERDPAAPDSQGETRAELHLVTEAARWYIAAFAAGDVEAEEFLENLLSRHDPGRSRARPSGDDGPGVDSQVPGGLGQETARLPGPDPLGQDGSSGGNATALRVRAS